MIKLILQKTIPLRTYNLIKQLWNGYRMRIELKKAYKYDSNLYSKHSATYGKNTATKLIGNIIKAYHVIEKGLTMPEFRLGFGQPKVIELSSYCIKYLLKYGSKEEQLQHAIQVILEYKDIHDKHHFELQKETNAEIAKLKVYISDGKTCSQKETTIKEYFKFSENSFLEFSSSRASIRNFINVDVPLEKITNALEIARNTPSACNRQCWRTYVYTEKEEINKILELQGGNRGFGHLTNKLIVITSELGLFSRVQERNQFYIDGGMYAMNLLYALHYQKIAACILNCSNWPEKDILLRKLCKINDSEVFIAMVACGIPPENFKIANSKRYILEKTNTIN